MDDKLMRMKEDAIKKLKELDDKQSMRYVVGNLKVKRFKKFLLLSLTISAMTMSGLLGYNIGKINVNKNYSTVYSDLERNTLYNASDEVIIGYLNGSFSDFCDYVNQGDSVNAQNKINELKESYFDPSMGLYDDYVETKNEEFHKKFKQKVFEYENVVSNFNQNFAFENSIYKYAKNIDGKLCVPYTDIITDSTLPENSYVEDNIVYVPINMVNKADVKSLGDD